MDLKKLKEEKEKMKVSSKLISSKECYSKQSGITLIALVVTIVVLLILAGVTINAVFSDSGIIKKAQSAQNKANESVQKDMNEINALENWMNEYTEEKEDYDISEGFGQGYGITKVLKLLNGTITTTDGTTIEINNSEPYATIEKTDENVKVEKINGYDIFGTIKIKLAEGIFINQLYIDVPGFKQGNSVICKVLIDNSWTAIDAEVTEDGLILIKNFAQTANIEILKGK